VGIEKRRGASVPRGSGLVEEDDGWAAAVSGGGDVQVTMENLRKANLRREKTAKQRRVRRGGGEEEAAEPARRRAATSARGEPGEDKARPKAGKIVISWGNCVAVIKDRDTTCLRKSSAPLV